MDTLCYKHVSCKRELNYLMEFVFLEISHPGKNFLLKRTVCSEFAKLTLIRK